MPNSRCFLIGHRDTSSDILPSLTTEIEHHIREQGITEFVVGQYGGFDRLAAHALYRCKTEYPGLTQSTISSWYRRKMMPSLPSLEKVCGALGITLSQLLAEDEKTAVLSPREQELLRRWSRLSDAQKQALLDLMDTF